jgi:hypothetical protein
MTAPNPVCDCCCEPLEDETAIVITTPDGRQITRHRRCHMLDLLDRA